MNTGHPEKKHLVPIDASDADPALSYELEAVYDGVWRFDIAVTATNDVTLSVTNTSEVACGFPLNQVVVLDGLSGSSIGDFKVTEGDLTDVVTFCGNDHPKHGNYVAFLIATRSNEYPVVDYEAGETRFVKAHITLQTESAGLDVMGLNLVGFSYRRKNRA